MATTQKKDLVAVVLAAGQGTRMKSSVPKVLHKLYDRPMLQYCIEALRPLRPAVVSVVVGHGKQVIEEVFGHDKTLTLAHQAEQKGTAHALMAGLKAIKVPTLSTVLVVNGDTPLITPETLKQFVSMHRRNKNAVSVLSFEAHDPTGYGRITRSEKGAPLAIVEEKDASDEQRAICEVNSGVYCIEAHALSLLDEIKVNPLKGEYYLTDLVAIALRRVGRVGVYCLGEEGEFLGVNSREDLAQAHEAMKLRTITTLMNEGVTFLDPYSTHVSPDVHIGQDTVIYPNVFIHGESYIGKGCTIMPNTRIFESEIRDAVLIKDSCVIEGALIESGAQVGPFAHIRPESRICAEARIGNFVELKKSTIGRGTKAMHLSYIGDAIVGEGANIGAGTITCNYDGLNKHKTHIGDEVFIGSDTQLVAPVKVGAGAYVGAGSTITKDVPPDALALSRTKQSVIEGWAKKKKAKK